jgi:HAD superfamily hydrolase (TIGR01490 family)
MSERSTVAVFDFDGTITTIDTFRDFIIWHLGPFRFWVGMFVTSPLIALYTIGIVGNTSPKHAIFKLLYRNYPAAAFRAACEEYAYRRLPSLIRPKALTKICHHLCEGHRLFIASASLKDWIEPWASGAGFERVIATNALIYNDRLTGDFSDSCCYGQLKVLRLKELGVSKDNSTLYAYGDSKGDRELLAIADYKSYREF